MARTTVKATYSLSPEVVARLERLAGAWKVSKSEALSRAIREAAEPHPAAYPIELLDALQGGAAIQEDAAAAWVAEARAERRQLGEPRADRPVEPTPGR